MSEQAPAWVRCPSCGERARATKTKDAGKIQAVRLRNGAFLYECSAPASDCGLRIGVFSIFVDADGSVVYDTGRLEFALEDFLKHARVVEQSIASIRGAPLSGKVDVAVIRYALGELAGSLDALEEAIP